MASDTDNTQYAMLIDISRAVGELKGDIHNVESKISRTDSKIEEVFDALTKKQDFLRDSIEAEIAIVRTDLKDAREEIKRLKERVAILEEKPKNRIFSIVTQFKSLFITAILAALVGWCISVSRDVAKSIKSTHGIVIESAE